MRTASALVPASTLVALLFLSSPAAHANPLTTFNLTSSFPSSIGAAGGTVAIDPISGAVGPINFSFAGIPASATEIASGFDLVGSGPNGLFELDEQWATPGNGFYSVDILLPVNTLVGYSGGPICSTTYPCYGGAVSGFAQGITGNQPYTSGTLSPTPEPASWILVATGAAGLLAILRRQQRNAARE